MTEITIELLIEHLLRFSETSKYEIDGIIVQPNIPYERNTSGNPDYAFAFKMRMSGNLKDTVVQDVEWNISKWGILKPRIRVDPISLGGTTITYATGFNGKYIQDHKIGPGAVITITRSGDVIPYIVEVKEEAKEAQMPEIPYKWNETKVDIYTEEYGEVMCVKLIVSFFSKLGIKHVSQATVEKMYDHGFDSLLKIIGASQEELEEIDGFGKRLAERTYENIHNGLQNVSLPLLLGASGIFGYGLGRKKIEALMDDIPNLLELYKKISRIELRQRILQVEGFSDKTTDKIISNLPWADRLYQGISYFSTFKQTQRISDNLKGMKFVMSGFRDKELEEEIIKRGGKMTSSISKNTSVLIVKNKGGKSTGKVKKAMDLGIEVKTKEEFIQNYL